MKYREQGLEGINFIIAGALANGLSFIAFFIVFLPNKSRRILQLSNEANLWA